MAKANPKNTPEDHVASLNACPKLWKAHAERTGTANKDRERNFDRINSTAEKTNIER
jgi:hypothetical protein